MSTQPVTGVEPPAEQAAVARVAQLRQLLAEVADPGASSRVGAAAAAPAGSFASALASATAAAPAGGEQAAASASQYEPLIQSAAARYGVDPAVLHGLIQQESGFDATAQSGAGAMGLTQLMPGTASSLGVRDPFNASEAIEGGARYLSQLMSQFGGNVPEALAAYNAGPGAVSQYGGIPPYAETQSYVSKVLGYAETYRQSHPLTNGAVLA